MKFVHHLMVGKGRINCNFERTFLYLSFEWLNRIKMTRIEKWQIYLGLKSNQSLELRLKDSTQHFDLHVYDDPGGYLLTHVKCHPNQYFSKKKKIISKLQDRCTCQLEMPRMQNFAPFTTDPQSMPILMGPCWYNSM